MNYFFKGSRHPLVTVKTILDGNIDWFNDIAHKDHKWHFSNLEYLYLKKVIFKDSEGRYTFIKTDLELYIKYNGLTIKEKFEKDSLRNSMLAVIISFLALIVSLFNLF